jgi:hypothetical protein
MTKEPVVPMQLNTVQRLALAYLMVVYEMRRAGITLDQNLKRKVGDFAKRSFGVELVDAWALCEELVRDYINWFFSPRRSLRGRYELPDSYTPAKGQILYWVLVDRYSRKEKVEIDQSFLRRVDKVVADTGLPREHVLAFCQEVLAATEAKKQEQ